MDTGQIVALLVKELSEVQTLVRVVAIVAAIVIIALGIGAWKFWIKYTQDRAAIRAQTDSIDEMKWVLSEHTTVAEKIKLEFDFKGWHANEHNTLRRAKLEELVRAAIREFEFLEKERWYYVGASAEPDPSSAGAELYALQKLYFPELEPVVLSLKALGAAYSAAYRGVGVELMKRALVGGRLPPDWNKTQTIWIPRASP